MRKQENKNGLETWEVIKIFRESNDLEEIKKAVENAKDRLYATFSTVDVRDKEGEKIPIEEAIEQQKAQMERGGVVTDMHSNDIVGRTLAWKVMPHPATNGRLGILQLNKIYSGTDYLDQVWKEIQEGKRTGSSLGGRNKDVEIVVEDGLPTRVLRGFEHYETATVYSPANQLALNQAVSAVAKSTKATPSQIDDAIQALQLLKKGLVQKPFAGYKDFDDCVRQNQDKDNPQAYCATIMRNVEGKSMEKARHYLKPGEEPPKGAKVQEGPHGGKYYETEGVNPEPSPDSGENPPKEGESSGSLSEQDRKELESDAAHMLDQALEAGANDPRESVTQELAQQYGVKPEVVKPIIDELWKIGMEEGEKSEKSKSSLKPGVFKAVLEGRKTNKGESNMKTDKGDISDVAMQKMASGEPLTKEEYLTVKALLKKVAPDDDLEEEDQQEEELPPAAGEEEDEEDETEKSAENVPVPGNTTAGQPEGEDTKDPNDLDVLKGEIRKLTKTVKKMMELKKVTTDRPNYNKVQKYSNLALDMVYGKVKKSWSELDGIMKELGGE
ncbi:hypothetical protein D6783_04560 [Candidatus Woesearchaeota archaeon]|nr:MAG: hypothetical protein D6783_04560 [Candidatus Woesearchaeota archaeon]